MKIILKHILRNIKEHKMRAFLILFSLFVSTSVFVISLTISDDLTIKVEDIVEYVNSNYCPEGDNTGSGCVKRTTEKKCAQGRDNGSGCEVVTYEKQNYCSSNGKDTGSGCVVPVKKTKK